MSEETQYLTFILDKEEYGIEILKVREIIGYQKLTKIPYISGFIKGIINLRGTIIPVFDLRTKFDLELKAYDKYTTIIVLEISGRIMGAIVDAVSDITFLTSEEVQPTPSFPTAIRTEFITGIGKKDDRLIILLSIDRIFSMEELEDLDAIR